MSRVARVVAPIFCLALVLFVAGCGESSPGSGGSSGGGGGEEGSSGSTTLRTAMSEAPAPLDPDTYYEAQALPILNGVYEGLVTYANNSPKIIPQLATKWEVSPDGLTYTFQIRPGVKFSDGNPVTAADAKASFERRIGVEGGPAYMLAEVKNMKAKGQTFTVELNKPQSAFMDYLASPYSPMLTDPAEIAAHKTSSDPWATKWLGSHSAGTGPYVLGEIKPGATYELTANPNYYRAKPYFKTVLYKIIPNIATQRLEVENGQLDIIVDDTNPRDTESLENNSKVQVKYFPALHKGAVWVNPSSKVFSSLPVRQALRESLDNEKLTEEIFGNQATPSTEVYPPGMLPKGAAKEEFTYDPEKLKSALEPYSGEPVTIGYYQEQQSMQTLADRLQVMLQEDGVEATTQAYPAAQIFGLPTHASQRPDLMTAEFNPDAVAPDTFARIYWYKNAAVNLLGCTVPKADALLDQAAEQPTAEAAVPLNIEAAEEYSASRCWINIADVEDVAVARPEITGFEHQLPWVFAIKLSGLKEE